MKQSNLDGVLNVNMFERGRHRTYFTIVLRRTAFRLVADSIISFFMPRRYPMASGGDWQIISRPAKFGAVAHHAVHDDRKPAGERDNGLSHPTPLGDVHRPGSQP